MTERNGWTPTEKKMLDLLGDGNPHFPEELHACLEDELSSVSAIRPHLTRIRDRLRPQGQDILCEYKNMKYMYRHVRLLSNPYDGKS